jgi:hypothetical protein
MDKTFASFDCSGFQSITFNGAMVVAHKAALRADTTNKMASDSSNKIRTAFTVNSIQGLEDLIVNSLSLSIPVQAAKPSELVVDADKNGIAE